MSSTAAAFTCEALVNLQETTTAVNFVPKICGTLTTLNASAKGIQFLLFLLVLVLLIMSFIRFLKGFNDWPGGEPAQGEAYRDDENKNSGVEGQSSEQMESREPPGPPEEGKLAQATKIYVEFMRDTLPWLFLLMAYNVGSLVARAFMIVSFFLYLATVIPLNALDIIKGSGSERKRVLVESLHLVWVFFWFINYFVTRKMPYGL
jgi:hypothetical protein